MCKLAEEGEGRRERATGRGESGCNKLVASGPYCIFVALKLAPDAVLEAAFVSARKHIEGDAASGSRCCDAGSARLNRALLDDINDSTNSSGAPLAM